MEEFDNVIILKNADGNDVAFEFLDLVEYEGEEYVYLLPVADFDGEIVILKVEPSDDEDEESYVSVKAEDTVQALFEIFKEKFKDQFNFTDAE